jgi:anti-sigma factor ChrR (cupin superfamily)
MKQVGTDDKMSDRALLYALGTLTLTEARAFEEHIAEGCDSCAAQLREAEAIAHALAFESDEGEPPPVVFDQLRRFAVHEKPSALSRNGGASKPFRSVPVTEGDWFESSPGVLVKRLYENFQTGTVTSLVRMLPGSFGTVHRHPGVEECIVIEGDFHVAGDTLGPGDYHVADAGSIHDKPFSEDGALLVIIGPPYERL